MAANMFASGSGDDTVLFEKAVDYLNVFVDTGATFGLSLDKGENFITLPAGFHSFRIGPTKEIQVTSDGDWQLVGVQA